MSAAFKEATRVSTGLLTSIERRCLLWMAARIPPSINADHLTSLAGIAMLAAGFCYGFARQHRWALLAVPVMLAINWFGDSLDGTLARVRQQPRPRYGFYVDHVLDTFGVLFLFAGLAWSGYMSPGIAAAFLIAHYLLSIELFLATYCLGSFQTSFWKCGPTELRIVLAAGTLALLWQPTVLIGGRHVLLFDVGGIVATAGLTLTAVLSFARNGRELYRAEPIPAVAKAAVARASVVIALWIGSAIGINLCLAADASAATLHADTLAAFGRYVSLTETRIKSELDLASSDRPLWVDRLPESQRRDMMLRLQQGAVLVSRMQTRDAGRIVEIPSGMGHHWIGTIFVPGAGVDRVVHLMQSYEAYPDVYQPAVRRSKVLSRQGNRFKVSLQLFMKKIVSVVLNTDYDVEYARLGPSRISVRSISTRIAEVSHPDSPDQREEPVGDDNGFLWRFNSYCTLEERNAGTYVQCESISLSRGIPTGLGWLIEPFVTSVPMESLEFTLGAMRRALTGARTPLAQSPARS